MNCKKLFNLDLHISVIADIKAIIKDLYKDKIEITNWSISGHNWVFNNPTAQVDIINQHTWKSINQEMIEQFQKRYDDFLNTFDGFIVTHSPVFCLLYEKYNKPIILINSCRYEQPFSFTANLDGWEWLNNGLKRLHNSGLLIPISNNKADKEYLLLGTGINSILLPSLCLYTNSSYKPIHKEAVVYGNYNFFSQTSASLIVPRPHCFNWSDLFSYKAIVHTPYEISTMSLFEQYSSGIPLFLPTRNFYHKCIIDGAMNLQSIYGHIYGNIVIPTHLQEPLSSIDFWLDRADFYDSNNFKYIYYYASSEDLINQLTNFTDPLKAERLQWIQERKINIYNKWYEILNSSLKLQI